MRAEDGDPLGSVIRETLRQNRADCPDAEVLAAHADRALDSAARLEIERHLASCQRCRETVLLMHRAAEAEAGEAGGTRLPPPRKASADRRSLGEGGQPGLGPAFLRRWPWLAGAAAAGLAVALWTATPPEEPREVVAVLPVAPEPARDKPADTPARKAPQPRFEPPVASANQAAPAARDAAESKQADQGRAREAQRLSQERLAEVRLREELRAKAEMRAKEDERANKDSRAGQPAAASAAPAAPAAPAPPVEAVPLKETLLDRARAPASRQESYRAGTSGDLFIMAGGAGPVLWRVTPTGAVFRSDHGGTTWSREAGIDAKGARAIAAPSSDVCWIVGTTGLIVRYERTRGWIRLQPPAQIEFVAVEASDALHATLTASDGRKFTTDDGGVTWRDGPV